MADQLIFTIEGGEVLARKLKSLGDGADAALVEAVTAGAEVLQRLATANASQISRELGENIYIEQGDGADSTVTFEIGPDRDRFWGLFFEFGADSHEIKPDQQQALQFTNRKFAARVKHPGVAEQPWLSPAFDEGKDAAQEAIAEALRKALL